MRLLIVGHGRMGTLVESLAPAYGFEVSGIVGSSHGNTAWSSGASGDADVAIDFTIPAAVPAMLPALAARGINVVIGTTGWQAHEAALRAVVAEHGIGVVVAPNFSLGMNLFQLVVEEAARRFAPPPRPRAGTHSCPARSSPARPRRCRCSARLPAAPPRAPASRSCRSRR